MCIDVYLEKKSIDLYTCDLWWFLFPFPLEPRFPLHTLARANWNWIANFKKFMAKTRRVGQERT